jgi:hypothetical protein
MRKAIVSLLGAVALFGCSDPSASSVVVSEKGLTRIATLDATTHALLFSATNPFAPFNNGVQIAPTPAAEAAAAAAPNQFVPSSCVVATSDGATVHYKLNNCDTPLGIIGISGVYSVTYADVTNGISVTIPRALLDVMGIPVFIQTAAVYTQNGDQRTLNVTSAGSAPGDDYNIIQAASSTLTWMAGSQCASEDASGALSINGTTLVQSVTGLMRCLDQCPQTATYTLANGTETLVTINFNGTANAAFNGQGKSGAVALACSINASAASSTAKAATAVAPSSLVQTPVDENK